jgi:hypothetical protein
MALKKIIDSNLENEKDFLSDDEKTMVVSSVKKSKQETVEPIEIDFVIPGTSSHLELVESLQSQSLQNTEYKKVPWILVDLDGLFFTQEKSFFDANFELFESLKILSSLEELNKVLNQKKPVTLFFNFNQTGQKINALFPQLNQKFPWVKKVLIVKGLSPEKKNAHENSPAKADCYMNWPQEKKQFEETLKNCSILVKK